jgi:hypothetical protein
MRLLVGVLLGVALAACSSKGDVSIGGGQSVDTTTADFAIAYVKRTLPTDPTDLDDLRAVDDLRQQRDFWTKADVYIRDKASPGGTERNITARITGNDFYDVRDLDVSADGKKLLFAMRGPLAANQQEEDPPSWNIWEYDVGSNQLHRVISDDVTAEAGEDVSPHYLPDGRILFLSTRQRDAKAILIDEGKSGFTAQTEDLDEEPGFVMHTMAADGSLASIRQTSFNQSHDRDLSIMRSGRVLYSRWDNESGNQNRGMSLYIANPDGSNMQLYYGARSHATGSLTAGGTPSTVQFVKPREMEDNRVLALTRPFSGTDFGGNLVIIDGNNYVENTQRTLAGASANVAATGPAQNTVTQNDIRTISGPSPGGRFNSAYPLWDGSGRILVGWSQCRLLDTTGTIVPCTESRLADPNAQIAPPLYSAWLLDTNDGTLKPVITPVENVMISDIVSLQPRTTPNFIADTPSALALAPDLAVGILDIRSVYDWDGAPWSGLGSMTIAQVAALPAAQRPARFLRIEKAVSIPDQDTLDFDRNLAFGRAGNFMREILGYVPIEPDGSVRVRVPANVAFNVTVVNANGRRIWTPNRVWQQLRPSEISSCNGCYYAPTTTTSGGMTVALSHGRNGLFNTANPGAAAGSACPGETQAQARSSWSCGASPYSAPTPSMNVIFDGAPTGDADISLRYNDLLTPIPTRQSCLTGWLSGCRSTISYPLQIKQLWSLVRADGSDADTVADTCTDCHNSAPRDAANQVKSAGEQLNLTDDTAQATPALQAQRGYDQLTQGYGFVIEVPDPNNPMATILVASPTNQPAAISAGSANASTRFFSIFAAGGSHAGRLSGAELRLLSEWVDIGTQYYNNPFDAPLN